MKKNLIIVACLTLFSAKLFAVEPIYSFKPKNPSMVESPYSLTGYKKLKQTYSSDPQNVVKLKLFPMIVGLFTVQYERSIKENMSVACDFSFLRRSISDNDGGVTFSAFGISPEFRFYPSGDASRGFFVGPYASYLNMSIKGEYTNSNGIKGTGELTGINALGGGVLLGWKWLIQDAFAIETHLGYNYLSLTIPSTVNVSYSDGTSETKNGPEANFSGGYPTAGLSLGYAF